MDNAHIESEFNRITKSQKSLDAELDDLISHIRHALWSYHGQNATMENVTIEKIQNGTITYNYITSFRREWDDPVYKTIPIEHAQNVNTIQNYYNALEEQAKQERKAKLETRLRNEQKQINLSEKETYLRLKAKFEPT